ncbi:MAG: glutamate racemase [Oscillospiraceae bacterium]|nr:glutamate racemase [Oscillospiraceae bacterium]
MDNRPIGVFDSGLGGLTAMRTLERLLPEENLIYFGDSRNAPYGTRTVEEIRALGLANAGFLAGQGVKAILVACGTVSSNAMELLRARFPLLFVSVLEAPCAQAVQSTRTGRVAVAATEATIKAGAFDRCLRELDASGRLTVFSKACQSLVRAVEAGHTRPEDPEAARAVAAELAPIRDFAPDTLLLACTHFPLMEDAIRAYLGDGPRLISVGDAAAAALSAQLRTLGLERRGGPGWRRYCTSGEPETFSRLAAGFLGHTITAERHGPQDG